MIRVIAGSAKGKKLKMVPGRGTRPIGDRVKESLFNIIGSGIVGADFLDLFAGTGSVGIEALSRGANSATFVENNPAAVRTIEGNLEHTNLSKGAFIDRVDVFRYLKGIVVRSYDYVYIAPPQYLDLWGKTLLRIDQKPECLNPDAWVIVQMDPVEGAELELDNLVFFDQRRYGGTQLDFYEFPGK